MTSTSFDALRVGRTESCHNTQLNSRPPLPGRLARFLF